MWIKECCDGAVVEADEEQSDEDDGKAVVDQRDQHPAEWSIQPESTRRQ